MVTALRPRLDHEAAVLDALARARTGITMTEAAAVTLSSQDIDPDTFFDFAVRGLADHVSNKLHEARHTPNVPQHTPDATRTAVLALMLANTMRIPTRYEDLTVDDWRMIAENSTARATGYTQRATQAIRIVQLLTENNVNTIRELDTENQNRAVEILQP